MSQIYQKITVPICEAKFQLLHNKPYYHPTLLLLLLLLLLLKEHLIILKPANQSTSYHRRHQSTYWVIRWMFLPMAESPRPRYRLLGHPVLRILQAGSFLEKNGRKTGNFSAKKRATNRRKQNFSRKKRAHKKFLFHFFLQSIYSAFITSGLSLNNIIHHKAQETS